ncbi:MAG TPA: HAD-IA family hydrolase [Bacteroidia bacterium]
MTLIRSNPDFKPELVRTAMDFFKIEKEFDECYKCFREYDLLCNRLSEISGKHIDSHIILLMILNQLKGHLDDIHIDALNEFDHMTQNLFLEHPPFFKHEGIPALMENIRQQKKGMSLISNTGFIKGDTLKKTAVLENILAYFDFTLFSDEQGISKPNKEMFQLSFNNIQNHQNIQKSEVLHIGDNEIADYQGALNFGYNALLI